MFKNILRIISVIGVASALIFSGNSIISADEETECSMVQTSGDPSHMQEVGDATYYYHPGNNTGVYQMQCFGEPIAFSGDMQLQFGLDLKPYWGNNYVVRHGRGLTLGIYYNASTQMVNVDYAGIRAVLPAGVHQYDVEYGDTFYRLSVDGVFIKQINRTLSADAQPILIRTGNASANNAPEPVLQAVLTPYVN